MDSKLIEEIELFDDGQYPGGTKVETKIVKYKNKFASNFFSIFDNLLEPLWLLRAYEYALHIKKPWGAYITMEDALSTTDAESLWNIDQKEKAISLVAVRALIIHRGGSIIGPDLAKLHGTAVWCLMSGLTNEVQYHIDYAELHRYETNTIYPPVYAGTCHLSPCYGAEDMIGGDFLANSDGLAHYQRFGYKTRLAKNGQEDLQHDLQTSTSWLKAGYHSNRGILHDGNYPHLSTPITHLRQAAVTGSTAATVDAIAEDAVADGHQQADTLKRVILGFNCFTEAVKECNLRAPEHSEAFNRTIKLYQRMAKLGIPITSSTSSSSSTDTAAEEGDEQSQSLQAGSVAATSVPSASKGGNKDGKGEGKGGGGLSMQEVMKNPVLAKLIIQAAKKTKGLS